MVLPNLNVPLSTAEFQSLKELSKGTLRGTTPAKHQAKLINLGYAKDALGGLMITDIGQLRVMKGS